MHARIDSCLGYADWRGGLGRGRRAKAGWVGVSRWIGGRATWAAVDDVAGRQLMYDDVASGCVNFTIYYYLRAGKDYPWRSFQRVVTKTRDCQCPIVPHGWAFRNTK